MTIKNDVLHPLLLPLKQRYFENCELLVAEQNLYWNQRIDFLKHSKLDNEDTKRDHPYLVLVYPSDKTKLPVLRWRRGAARYDCAYYLPLLEDGVSVDPEFLFSDLPICPKTEKAARKLFERKAKLLRKMKKAISHVESNLMAAEKHAESLGQIIFNEVDFDIIEELESYYLEVPSRKKTAVKAPIISNSQSL